jgi:hypothetical protein
VQSFVPTNGDGSSIFVTFAGQRTVTSWDGVDAGWTIQSSVATEVCCITKDTTFTDGTFNIADTVTGKWRLSNASGRSSHAPDEAAATARSLSGSV